MTDERDLTELTEAAWAGFRGRLADHVAAMADHDVLVVEYADALAAAYGDDADDPEGLGAAPYVQLVAFGCDRLRLEAVSDAYLDPELVLTLEQESLLVDLGWAAPTGEDGDENFHAFAEVREADRVAVLLVRTMREVWGVPHPAFLLADGLEVDPEPLSSPAAPAPAVPAGAPTHPDPDLAVVLPRGREHLQELVDAAMEVVFPDLRHDGDGDIPIRAGGSVVYVRVRADRPAVELYAEVVVDPVDRPRLQLELGLLNRAHPCWQFVGLEHAVVMRQELLAVPFSGMQLRAAVERFVEAVDGIAQDLVARVGGRLFHQPEPVATAPSPAQPEGDPAGDPAGNPAGDLAGDLAMVGLLELCHLGRPRAATVAGLFGHDRAAIIRQLVRIRTGRQPCDGHDVDDVLNTLRRALRLVADGEQRPAPRPGPRSVQESLLSDDEAGEDTLDLGWPA